MDKKWSRLAWLALASLVVAGCSAQGTTETVVINDNVQLESSLADSSLDVSRQSDIEVKREIAYTGIFSESNEKTVYFNENGNFYSLDLETDEEKKLAEFEVIEISDDGQSVMSYEDGELYVHNLQNGEKYFVVDGSPERTRFMGDKVADYTTKLLSLIDIEEKETFVWSLDMYPDATISSLKKGKDGVYLAARSEDGYGVYLLSNQGEKLPIVEFLGEDTSFIEFDVLQNGSVIFNGDYDGKTGIYYWDKETNEVEQLVAGGKDKEGIWTPFYNLSPDETKILFDIPVQIKDAYKTNVYMAELVDGQLANSVRIMENASMFAVILYTSHWSEDSNKLYIMTSDLDKESVGNMAVFTVND